MATPTRAEDPAGSRLRWIIGGLIGLGGVILLATIGFWRATRPPYLTELDGFRSSDPTRPAGPGVLPTEALPVVGAVGATAVGATAVGSAAVSEARTVVQPTVASAPVDPSTSAPSAELPPLVPVVFPPEGPPADTAGIVAALAAIPDLVKPAVVFEDGPAPAGPPAPAPQTAPAPQHDGARTSIPDPTSGPGRVLESEPQPDLPGVAEVPGVADVPEAPRRSQFFDQDLEPDAPYRAPREE